jgi:hypothetical protein
MAVPETNPVTKPSEAMCFIGFIYPGINRSHIPKFLFVTPISGENMLISANEPYIEPPYIASGPSFYLF